MKNIIKYAVTGLVLGCCFNANAKLTVPTFEQMPVLAPEQRHSVSCLRIFNYFTRAHYKVVTIDNAFTKKVIDRFVTYLDYNHSLYTKKEIDEIYANSPSILQGLEKCYLDYPYAVYNENIKKRYTKYKYMLSLLDKGINLNTDKSIEIDRTSGNIKDKKLGFYYADQEIYKAVAKETGTEGRRHPLTFILEAADDIAYKTADIEDAFVKGYISYGQLRRELKMLPEGCSGPSFDPVEKLDRKYQSGIKRGVMNPEEYAVKNWIVQLQGFLISCATYGFTSNYEAIMDGSYDADIFKGTYGEELMNLLGDMAYRRVFSTPDIYRMEVTESVILDFLMTKFVNAVLYYDTEKEMSDIDLRLISFISENYKSAYHNQAKGKSEAEKLYLRLLLVTDYLCGMTDSYAKRLYQEMNAII